MFEWFQVSMKYYDNLKNKAYHIKTNILLYIL